MEDARPLILFRADGNCNIGLGHIKRSEVLAAELAAAGRRVAFLTTRDDFATAYLEQKGFLVHPLEKWSGRPEMFSLTVEAVAKIRPAVVFLDVINTELEAVESMKNSGAKVAAIDDLGPGAAAVDALIGVDIGILEELLPQAARERAGGNVFAGADYAIIDPRFVSLRDSAVPEKFVSRKIFVGFGGSDPCGSTKPVVEALMGSGLDFEAHVVVGPCMEGPDEIARLVKRGGSRFTSRVDPPDLPEIMAASTIAICGVGQSLFELNMLGVPALLATQSPLHEKFGENYQKGGSAVHLGRHDLFSPEEMLKWCGRLLDDRRLWLEMHRAARRLIDGRGSARICDIIGGLLPRE